MGLGQKEMIWFVIDQALGSQSKTEGLWELNWQAAQWAAGFQMSSHAYCWFLPEEAWWSLPVCQTHSVSSSGPARPEREREREIVREGFTGDVRFITASALKRPHTVQREKSNWELKKIASAFSNRYCWRVLKRKPVFRSQVDRCW